jgi:peptidoglycan/xylan/chitin deacetylase (PgdA/CDA1 family)
VNVRRALNGTVAFLLLPLSLVPLYFAVPRLRGVQDAVAQDRRPLDAPKAEPTQAELGAWRTVPAFRGAVPVLAYHGVNELGDHYSVSQAEFAKQMEMLSRAGFHTVSIAQYARFLSGDSARLPDRPILITFDDGRLDSYRGADKVLAEQGFRATMFVIAGAVEQSSPFYLNWDELRRMAQGGRWDVQEHAGVGHVNVRYDKAGHKGPSYSHRRFLDDGQLESFADYRDRVAGDILWAKQTLSEKIPGFTPWAFAVPFGDYGQNSTNDPRIAPFLDAFLGRQFRAVFLTWPPDYSTPSDDHSRLPRIEIHGDTGAMRLYRWLRDRIPTAAKTHQAAG